MHKMTKRPATSSPITVMIRTHPATGPVAVMFEVSASRYDPHVCMTVDTAGHFGGMRVIDVLTTTEPAAEPVAIDNVTGMLHRLGHRDVRVIDGDIPHASHERRIRDFENNGGSMIRRKGQK